MKSQINRIDCPQQHLYLLRGPQVTLRNTPALQKAAGRGESFGFPVPLPPQGQAGTFGKP